MFKKKSGSISKQRLQQALGKRKAKPAAMPKPRLQASRAERQQTWVPCLLCWPPNRKAHGICMDISETGARIRNRKRMPLPPRFRFQCPRLGIDTRARLVRQDDVDIAIAFETRQNL